MTDETNRATAHFYAGDLLRAIVEQDTCDKPYLRRMRAERLHTAFCETASRLGYRVERIAEAAQTEDAA